jgi:hypothetical protein
MGKERVEGAFGDYFTVLLAAGEVVPRLVSSEMKHG